jgi:phospholipid/cholesterol/gamma-HCH transport system substrate-binding protein
MTTRRRRKPAGSERSVAATLAISLGGILVCAVIAWAAWTTPDGVPGTGYYTLVARFDDTAGLGVHSEVRLSGERVGQAIHPRFMGGTAVMDLQLNRSIAPLRADSKLVVRSKGLLGQRFLELQPGRAGAPLDDGDQLRVRNTSSTVTIPQTLTAFDPRTRRRLGDMIDGLGAGVFGRSDDLNGLFETSPSMFTDLGSLSRAVSAREGAAQRFVPSLGSAAAAAQPAREDIATGFDPYQRALEPFAARGAALRSTLDVAPAALAATRSGLLAATPVLAQARRLSRAAAATLRPAPAALRATASLLAISAAPLRAARGLLDQVPPVVAPVKGLSRVLPPVLPRVEGILQDTIPLLEELAPRRCEILQFGRNWRSMLENGIPAGGAVGPTTSLRLLLLAGQESIASFDDPMVGPMGRNPYPAPCVAGTEPLP